MSANGHLTSSELAPIPGGQLQNAAARAWNAMRAHIGRETGIWIMPAGSRSTYRSIELQQYFWDLYQRGGNLAAHVGYSNHGLGLAVDVASPHMVDLINRYGAPYGWQKRWSDAPGEWWHVKWRAGDYAAVKSAPAALPTLHHGQKGPSIKKLQKMLRGLNLFSGHITGFFGDETAKAVRRFQTKHHMHPDGVVGPRTWAALKAAGGK